MPCHPFDFEINANVFSTPELTEIFDEKTRYQRWLDFEAALAKAQAEIGVIPEEAAREIGKKAKLECLDLDSIREGYRHSRNSLMPLITELRKACDNSYGEYVHFGATTQDVIDTAQILECRDVVSLVYRDLRSLELGCLDLTKSHRATPIIARTHGQHALPTTLGLKTAVWACEVRRHVERLKAMSGELAFGQLSGAVGTMAALGPHAMEVGRRTLRLLGLKHRALAWHNSRDVIGELASIFCLLVATLGKIANEIFQLQKAEISELREPAPTSVASTTMPHKRNPVICERIIVLSRQVRYMAGAIIESMAHEHERDARCLWGEWLAVPQLCIHTGAAVRYMLDVISGLEVNVDRMLTNLRVQKEMITSEWLLFRMSRTLGKMKALEKLHELSTKALNSGTSFRDALKSDPDTAAILSDEDMEYFDHPEGYIGHALEIVDLTVKEIEEKRAVDPEELI
jgi:3-carboxy-cis,cis-muconate cycloisomerase